MDPSSVCIGQCLIASILRTTVLIVLQCLTLVVKNGHSYYNLVDYSEIDKLVHLDKQS